MRIASPTGGQKKMHCREPCAHGFCREPPKSTKLLLYSSLNLSGALRMRCAPTPSRATSADASQDSSIIRQMRKGIPQLNT